MKINHFFLAITIALAAGACSDNTFIPAEDEETVSMSNAQSIQRSEDEAMAYAAQFLNIFPHKESRSLPDIKIHALTNKTSRSSASTDTLLYIAQYGENQGYAIITGSRELSPVLAYVEEGNFFDLENANNGGFQMYVQAASDYVESSMRRSSMIDRPIIKPAFNDWTIHYNDTIAPKLTVAWSQEYPEGYFCPNRLSGCAQTALAQILSYYELPTEINLTYPGHTVDKVTLDWSEIKKHSKSDSVDWSETNQYGIVSHNGSCSASEQAHMTIAYLCRELGHRNNAVYTYKSENERSTGASIESVSKTASALRDQVGHKFKVAAIANYTTASFLLDRIKDGVVYMRGSTTPNSGGHAWVADGGLKVGTVRTHVDYGMGLDGSNVVTVTENLEMLVHFNWGWGGRSNGYFNPDVFDSREGVSYDSYPSLDGGNFKYDVKFIPFYTEQMTIL